MRLIDATALELKVLEWMPSDPCGREEKEHPFETDIVVSLMMEIEEAPTIENRPKGEWILEDVQRKEDVENDNYSFRCSECGYRDIHSKCVEVPFCWHCGARMEGVEDETD